MSAADDGFAALVMFRCIVLIVAVVALFGCNWQPYSRSTSGVSALDKKVLYDFRQVSRPAPPQLDATTRRRVLSAVSPAYYDDPAECSKHPNGLVLTISGAATGSFSAPKTAETAYLVQVTPCGQSRPFRAHRVLVFAGEKLNANIETRYDFILNTEDLNRDGMNELLLAAGSPLSSQAILEATLVRFEKNALITVEDFGAVYRESCVGSEAAVEAVVISFLPRPAGQMPAFVAERYRAPCPAKPGQKPNWQRLGN